HAIELALDFVQAAQDQGEAVSRGHGSTHRRHQKDETPATTSGQGLSWQTVRRLCGRVAGGVFFPPSFGGTPVSRIGPAPRLVYLRQRFVYRSHSCPSTGMAPCSSLRYK